MIRQWHILVVLVGMIVFFPRAVPAERPLYIPPAMNDWQEWVRYGNEQFFCPSHYDDADVHVCIWPETLNLVLDRTGGSFQQSWTVLTPGWVPLPGDTKYWPMAVTLNGKRAAVVRHEGRPCIEMPDGRHTVTGKFLWDTARQPVPQSFPIPAVTGLVNLTVEGREKKDPFIDENSRIWIDKPSEEGASGAAPSKNNVMDVQIFRLIEDTLPLQFHNLIRLTVSGERRRVKLTSIFPDRMPAVSIAGRLPAKLNRSGDLWIEVKPGQWEIQIRSVLNHAVETIGPVDTPYGDEIWSFKPYPHLRMVTIEGITAIDPEQSTMPEQWKQYASFSVKQGDVVTFKQRRRGSPDTVDDSLHLSRDLWLDFNGGGLTVRDRISGRIGQRHFLGMTPENYRLGRLILSDRDKLVTRLDDRLTGIVLEKGPLNLTGVSRIPAFGSGKRFDMGWDARFQAARGVLHLPPGWFLIGVDGAHVSGRSTWIDRWSLLDFFLIMVIAFAVAKLWHWWWGPLFLVGLGLIWQETYAPQYVWLNLVVAAALLRLLPMDDSEGRGSLRKKILNTWYWASLIVLVGTGLLFCHAQLRAAIYPQLESRGGTYPYPAMRMAPEDRVKPSAAVRMEKFSRQAGSAGKIGEKTTDSLLSSNRQYYLTPDQNVAIQTGPGIPEWRWKSIAMDYGIISGSHSVVFWLLSPIENSLVALIRVGLLLLLISRFININARSRKRAKLADKAALLAVCLVLFGPMPDVSAAFPSRDLLDELQQRLIAPNDCFPDCAAVSTAGIRIQDTGKGGDTRQSVQIRFEVNTAVETAVPLPAGSASWTLFDLKMDGKPYPVVIRQEKELWSRVPDGVHVFELQGVAYGRDELRIRFPLRPHYVDLDAPGWVVQGLETSHRISGNVLVLTRQKPVTNAEDKSVSDTFFTDSESGLSNFFRVQRTVLMGLEWRVVTRVERWAVSRNPRAAMVTLPLLRGERVRTEGLTIDNEQIKLEFSPHINRIEWQSSLPITSRLTFNSPETANWSEIWELEASSLWNYAFKGLPAVYLDQKPGASWYPRPGEQLEIDVFRLPAAAGVSLTVDRLKMNYHIGKEYHRLVLNADIRTSQGALHPIVGPEDGELKHVKVNGRRLPVSGSARKLLVPLQPGTQKIEVEWHQPKKNLKSWFSKLLIPSGMILPEIDMTCDVTNIDIFWHLPSKLWLLATHGPRFGPAILFWGYLAVIVLSAVLLGEFSPSPLKIHQWLLLGIGLAVLDVKTVVLVAGWFIAVQLRETRSPASPVVFNLMQIGLILWGVFVAAAFFHAVQQGLLGIPDMQVTGNGSNSQVLHWTADRAKGRVPRPLVIFWSLYIYRMMMFVWALWLAGKTVAWSKWAADTLRVGGAWKKHAFKRLKTRSEEPEN